METHIEDLRLVQTPRIWNPHVESPSQDGVGGVANDLAMCSTHCVSNWGIGPPPGIDVKTPPIRRRLKVVVLPRPAGGGGSLAGCGIGSNHGIPNGFRVARKSMPSLKPLKP